jgi:hypothetical protein
MSGSATATATESDVKAECDYNDGSNHDTSDYLTEDDDAERPRLTFQ